MMSHQLNREQHERVGLERARHGWIAYARVEDAFSAYERGEANVESAGQVLVA